MTDDTKAMAMRVWSGLSSDGLVSIFGCEYHGIHATSEPPCTHVLQDIADAVEPEIAKATAERREDHATLRNYFSTSNAGVNVSRPIGHAIAIHKIAIARLRDAEARVRALEARIQKVIFDDEWWEEAERYDAGSWGVSPERAALRAEFDND